MISRIAAVHSVAPIISDPIYGPKTLNSQLVNRLLVTSGMMPSAPGAVILNLPAHSNITIIPMLQTRKGIFRSATNAAIFVRTLFACDALADVVSVIKGLLHVMIHRCQILKADLNVKAIVKTQRNGTSSHPDDTLIWAYFLLWASRPSKQTSEPDGSYFIGD